MSKIINEDDFDKIIKNLRAEGIEPFPFIAPDFNFSAKFYAGWLRWLFANMESIKVVINQLLKRNLATSTTDSIILSQDGDWTTEFVITLAAVLKVSKETTHITLKDKDGNDVDFEAQNAIEIFKDGAYVPDLKPLLTYLNNGNNQLLNTDVANHLTLSSDKNTLTLTRKLLNGLAVASDTIKIGIGDIIGDITNIKNEIKNIWNQLGKFEGGTVTVLQNHWDGKVNDGGTIDTTLTNGSYQIFIESPTVGSFSLRLPWAQSSDINQVQTGFSLPLSNQVNGDFGFIKCTINAGTAGKNPKVLFAETRYSKASGTTTVKNGNTDWYILIIKKEKAVTIG